ncbi:MAG: amidohydrolase family protein [Gemmatimonadetes bacterium]|nr:amidohydrolase family protein [Gemmatimonadota bacterium]
MSSAPRALISLLTISLAIGTPVAAQQDRAIALVGGQLLDGYEAPPIHHAAVIIRGNRIVAVGPASDIEIPPDAEVINTAGKTMMPGMVDAHVHIMILGHGDYADWFPWFEGRDDLVYETSAKQLLAAGVTAGVDLAAPMSSLAFRDRVNANEVPGPRLLVSGPWITRYAWDFLPDELRVLHSSPDEARERAEMLIDAGVDVIKTWIGTTEEDMRAIKSVAGPAGVPIHCHVYEEEVVWGAIRGGCDVLQHAGSGGSVPAYSDELVAHIAMEGIPVVQTIAHRIWIYPATLEFPERLWDPDILDSFPTEIREQVLSSYTKDDFWRRPYFSSTPRQIRNSEKAARQFIDADALMAMGTDTGSPLNFHAESAWREVSALVDMGMTEIEAISSATKVSAQVLGLREVGTIEPGKLADIIVVDGNPLFDINVLGYVTDVIKDGIIYKRDGVPVWEMSGMRTSTDGS